MKLNKKSLKLACKAHRNRGNVNSIVWYKSIFEGDTERKRSAVRSDIGATIGETLKISLNDFREDLDQLTDNFLRSIKKDSNDKT